MTWLPQYNFHLRLMLRLRHNLSLGSLAEKLLASNHPRSPQQNLMLLDPLANAQLVLLLLPEFELMNLAVPLRLQPQCLSLS